MQNAAMLHAGKALTEPLLIMLAIATVAVIASMRHRAARPAGSVALVALLLLSFFSTRLASSLLERSLAVDAEASARAPKVIVVAAGGMLDTLPPQLSGASESRVAAGVTWWQQHRDATLVMSGADARRDGVSTVTIEMMRDAAVRAGVPPSAVFIEPRSTNTREHPIGVLQLPGITRATPIGIVTSDWHMRRTMREFRREFEHVSSYPATTGRQEPFDVADVLPSSQELRVSTRLLHEWIGMAWYALRR